MQLDDISVYLVLSSFNSQIKIHKIHNKTTKKQPQDAKKESVNLTSDGFLCCRRTHVLLVPVVIDDLDHDVT